MPIRDLRTILELDRLLGLTELAEHFELPVTTFSTWRHRAERNQFPEPVLRRRAGSLFDVDEVAAWLAERE